MIKVKSHCTPVHSCKQSEHQHVYLYVYALSIYFPWSNQPEAAKLLLDAGANINCKNRKGNTPLMIAGAVGHYTLLAVLANHPKIDLQAEVHACSS